MMGEAAAAEEDVARNENVRAINKCTVFVSFYLSVIAMRRDDVEHRKQHIRHRDLYVLQMRCLYCGDTQATRSKF